MDLESFPPKPDCGVFLQRKKAQPVGKVLTEINHGVAMVKKKLNHLF
jgi:hypothetical protein